MIWLNKIVTCILGNGGKRNDRTKGLWSLLYTHLRTCSFLWGKNNCAKILQADLFVYFILITSAAWFWVCCCKQVPGSSPGSPTFSSQTAASLFSLEKLLQCAGGKTAIRKPAAYEQSPPSAVFLSFKIASCKERTTGMGSCHFYCLATVILTEDRKQYIRSKLKTATPSVMVGVAIWNKVQRVLCYGC